VIALSGSCSTKFLLLFFGLCWRSAQVGGKAPRHSGRSEIFRSIVGFFCRRKMFSGGKVNFHRDVLFAQMSIYRCIKMPSRSFDKSAGLAISRGPRTAKHTGEAQYNAAAQHRGSKVIKRTAAATTYQQRSHTTLTHTGSSSNNNIINCNSQSTAAQQQLLAYSTANGKRGHITRECVCHGLLDRRLYTALGGAYGTFFDWCVWLGGVGCGVRGVRVRVGARSCVRGCCVRFSCIV